MARNAERHRDAAAVQVERAELAIERVRRSQPFHAHTAVVLDRYRQALQLRIDHPDATLAELADKACWSKDRYAAVLRRALKYGSKR